MRVKYGIGLFVVVAAQVFGQIVTTLNLSTQGHNPDFASFPFTRPISTGPAVPATCQLGQMFFNTAAVPGQNIYACTQTNTWTLLGAFTLLPAGPSRLGGVVVTSSSALNIDSNGLLSANVGTGPGTLAAGNDTRIVNALQPTSQIPATNVTGLARSATIDTTTASNISTGTLNATLLPSTINSNTTGNAATASSLAVVPRGCNTGQFSVGISAIGTANCAQVAYAQLSGTPSMYNQAVQVAGSAQTQRTILNFAAGSNLTITPSDNGSNTTTLTISGTGLQAPSTTNKLVKYTTGSSTTAAQASDVTSALGFTPQNVSGLNAPSGYAGLDANGLLLASEMPPAISSNTSGKAATATALAAVPVICPGGQFATGIGANGNAICGSPTGTGGLPDPGANGLVKRTGPNTDAVAAAGVDYYAPGTQINVLDLPNTITSSITGNASTATALAAAPTACAPGQVLAQILPNGNPATCVASDYNTVVVNGAAQAQRAKLAVSAGANITITPTDNGSDTTTLTIAATGGTGGGLPDPGANGLVKRTAANTDTAAIPGTDYYAPGTVISDNDLPATITSNITGNAASATALKVAPTACSGGQFVQQIGPNGNPVACGSASTGGPTISSGTTIPATTSCTSSTTTSGYMQTGTTAGNSSHTLWICSTGPSTYNGGYMWVPQTGNHVDVRAFGAKGDSSTDDLAAIQAAVNFAYTVNQQTKIASSSYLGTHVFFPCGAYAISAPIVLPRIPGTGGGGTGDGDFPYSTVGGVVGLIGESPSCVALMSTSTVTGFQGVGGAVVTATGSGYTSSPTVTITGGGCTTEPQFSSILFSTNDPASAGNGALGDVFFTVGGSHGTGCTSMPTCTVTGGGGSGAQCMTIGHALIEWADITGTTGGHPTFIRTNQEDIENFQVFPPAIDGAMGIYFTYGSNTTPYDAGCSIGGGAVCDRMSNARFANLYFSGSNAYNPYELLIKGDCAGCVLDNINANPSGLGGKYSTVNIGTGIWAQASSGEGEGLQYGHVINIGGGGSKGGSAASFQGRIQRERFSDSFCDGTTAMPGYPAMPNTPYQFPACYAFWNSANVELHNLGNEGAGGYQMYLQNSTGFEADLIGIAAPGLTNQAGLILGGVYLVNSSNNVFRHRDAAGSAYNTFTGINTLSPTSGHAGTGYVTGDKITVVQSGADSGIAIVTASGGAVTSLAVFSNGEKYSVGTGLSTTGGTGTGLQVDIGSVITPYATFTDATSYRNSFFNWGAVSSSELSLTNTITNYIQYCTACVSNSAWSHMGTSPF